MVLEGSVHHDERKEAEKNSSHCCDLESERRFECTNTPLPSFIPSGSRAVSLCAHIQIRPIAS